MRFREQGLGALPDLWRSHIAAVDALQDAFYVAIDDRGGTAEGEAGDGSGGVAADAGQLLQGFGRFGKATVVVVDDFPRTAMQHARAPVIAEAAPAGEDGVFGCSCERGKVGEAVEEFSVVIENGSYACLLKHDLRQPDGIGV